MLSVKYGLDSYRKSDIKSVTFTCSDEQRAELEEIGYSLQPVEYVYYSQDEKGE